VNQFTQLLQHSADLLSGVWGSANPAEDALRLIAMLGYGDGDVRRNRLRVAFRAETVFYISD
jgi:hypothetical protein